MEICASFVEGVDRDFDKKDIRILTLGDDPRSTTGFAKVHLHLLKGLYRLKEERSNDVSITSIGWHSPTHLVTRSKVHIQDGLHVTNDTGFNLIRTDARDEYAVKTFQRLLPYYQPSIVFTIGDPWMVKVVRHMKRQYNYLWVPYVPIDGLDMAQVWIEIISDADYIVSYSSFGTSVMKAAKKLEKKAMYQINHGVDPETYKSLEQNFARQNLGIGKDEFIVLWLARNTPRKRIDLALEAFAKFIAPSYTCVGCQALYFQGHNDFDKVHAGSQCLACNGTDFRFSPKKENTRIFLYTTNVDIGFDIPKLSKEYGLEGKLLIPANNMVDVGVSEGDMAQIYNAADVFLSTATGEGWGLPIHEAMACGIPVVVPNFGGYMEDLVEARVTGFSYDYDVLDRDPGTGYIRCRPNPTDAVKYLDLIYHSKRGELKNLTNRWILEPEALQSFDGLVERVTKQGQKRAHQLSWDRFSGEYYELTKILVPEFACEKVFENILTTKSKKKTIAFIGHSLLPAWGGAERSMLSLLIYLKNKLDCNVVLYYVKTENNFHLRFNNFEIQDGITVIQGVSGERFIRKFLEEIQPDMVFTQLLAIPEVARLCNNFDIPYYAFIRSFEGLCDENYVSNEFAQYYPSVMELVNPFAGYRKDLFEVLDGAQKVIFNSFYLKEILKTTFNNQITRKMEDNSRVLYPIVDPASDDSFVVPPTTTRTPINVSLIKPTRAKGSLVFIETARLAQQLDSKEFRNLDWLMVGYTDKITRDIFEKLGTEIPKLKVAPSSSSMAEIYAKSAIVLFPSVFKEAFGRVPIECAINNVPVLSSNAFGIPESSCELSLINDYHNPHEWIARIEEIMTNPAKRQELLDAQQVSLLEYQKEMKIQLETFVEELSVCLL